MSVNKNSEGSTALKNASLDQILDTAKIVLQQNGVLILHLGSAMFLEIVAQKHISAQMERCLNA